MFVQTHFQRSRHQTPSAQPSLQKNINHKPSRCVSSSRSTKKVDSKKHKNNEATYQDTVTKSISEIKKLNHDKRPPKKLSTQADRSTFLGLISESSDTHFDTQDADQTEQYRMCACQSLDLVPASKYDLKSGSSESDSFGDYLLDNRLNTKVDLEGRLSMVTKSTSRTSGSSTYFPYLLQSNNVTQQEPKITDNPEIRFSILYYIIENLTFISRSLTYKITNNTKHDTTNGDRQIISKLMRAHPELLVSFAVDLVSYQLETWRLLLDDTHNIPIKELGTVEREGKVCSHECTGHKFATNHCNYSSDFIEFAGSKKPSKEYRINHMPEFNRNCEKKGLNQGFINKMPIDCASDTLKSLCTSAESVLESGVSMRTQLHGLRSHVDHNSCINELPVFESNHGLLLNRTEPFDTNSQCRCNESACTFVENSTDRSLDSRQLLEFKKSTTKLKVDMDDNEILQTNSLECETRGSRKLSLTGTKGRIWFLERKSGNCVNIQRSEEIFPDSDGVTAYLSPADRGALASIDLNSTSQSSKTSSGTFDDRIKFVQGLGAGQIVSRHALVSSLAGEVQLHLTDTRGILEMTVIQVRGLHTKDVPATYVKVYLIRKKKCIGKYKTRAAPRGADPFYHQRFVYREGHNDCMLQIIVWGEFNKRNKKNLLGAAQIQLDALDISGSVVSWYKLFEVPSLKGPFLSSKSLRRRLLSIATESPRNWQTR